MSIQEGEKMSDIFETEVKIEIDRQKKFDEIYEAIGKPDWTTQRNYIFSFSGNILRLRYEDKTGKAYLTFKGKDQGEEFNSREERECNIPAELFESVSKSLTKRPIQEFNNQPHYYEKSRAQVNYGNCVVCLDNFFGTYYCEIEGQEADIKRLIQKFGLEEFPREKRSYLEMLMERMNGR
jgi:adenylate cyclase class IV